METIKEKNNNFVMLTNDLLFKEMYGNPKNIRFLEDLLESYFDYPIGYLKGKVKVSFETPLEKTKLNDKTLRGDLVAVINNEVIVNVEMYSLFNEKSLKKSKSYIMRIYSTQLTSGENYDAIKRVTQINFVDDMKLEIQANLKSTFYFGPKNLSNDIQMDIIQLDLARKMEYNLSERFVKRLKFLGARTKKEREEIAKGDEMLMNLDKWLENYQNDESLRDFFNDEYWNQQIYYTQGINDEREDIVKNMLRKHIPIKDIMEITKLSEEKIIAIKTKLETNN